MTRVDPLNRLENAAREVNTFPRPWHSGTPPFVSAGGVSNPGKRIREQHRFLSGVVEGGVSDTRWWRRRPCVGDARENI